MTRFENQFRTVRAALLLLVLALTLSACSLASEPVPAGPIESGPAAGETIATEAPAATEEAVDELLEEDTAAAEEAEEPADEPAEEAAAEEPAAAEEAVTGETTEEAEAAEAAEELPDPNSGVVTGQVIMMTEGESLPDDLEVTLRGIALDADGNVVDFLEQSQPLDENDSFRFTDLALDVPQAAYVVTINYDGVSFENGVLIDEAVAEMDLPITAYAVTTDPSVVMVNAQHLILTEHPEALSVTQVSVFSNTSDRVFVTEEPIAGGSRGSVAVSLPEGAYGVQFQEGAVGGRFIQEGDTYYDLEYLLPGMQGQAIVMTYLLPYTGDATYEFPILYDTGQITVLSQQADEVEAEGLVAAGEQTVDGQPYTTYSGQNFTMGDTLVLDIKTAGAAGGSNTLVIVLAAAAGVLLIAGGGYWYFLRRDIVDDDEDTDDSFAMEMSAREEQLLDEIAELDADFDAGNVDRFEYETRRAQLKAELAAAMQADE